VVRMPSFTVRLTTGLRHEGVDCFFFGLSQRH